MAISYTATCALIEAGWYPGRHIDITPYAEALEREGYRVLPAAARLLHEYGGLSVPFTRAIARHAVSGQFHFCADRAAEAIDHEGYVAHFADTLASAVCVVGAIVPDGTTLLMTPDGALYGGFDTRLVRFGVSVEQAIECLVDGWPVTIIRE